MDVSAIVEAEQSKHTLVEIEKDIPVDVDLGLLTATDLNPIDSESYQTDREAYLAEVAREGVQILLGKLFTLPTQRSPDGPLAMLPKPSTILPRAKPLPKPKPQTKWEQFANAKGISKTIRDKQVWDEEKQEWVQRWGRGGKNKEVEEQWIHELKDNADDNYNPAAAARKERKERVAKNEGQHQKNLARGRTAEDRARKEDIEHTLLTTKGSTASMGKFDKKLQGEPKVRGIKRKFAPAETSIASEKANSLALISKLDGSSSKKSRKDFTQPPEEKSVLNVRKAVKFASGGRGAMALGRESSGGGRGRGGGRGGSRGGRGGGRGGRGRGK